MKELPDGWMSSTLRELVFLKTGPFGSSLHKSDYVQGGIPLVNPIHIANGRIIDSSRISVSIETARRLSDFQLQQEDIVLGRRGEMGRCAVVNLREVGWLCGTGSLIVRPNRLAFDAKFLQIFLSSASVVEYLLAASVGSTMANLNQEHLLGLSVNLPPLAEQNRIVAKIEELLSDLDAGVAELKAAQKKLTQYRQSLLKAAVEGALTAEWRQHNPPQETGVQLLERILTERRARWEAKQLAKFASQGKAPPKDWQSKYPAPVAPDVTVLPELPQGWVWATVEQLGAVQLGRQRSPDKLRNISPVRYIRAANITEKGIDFLDVLEMDFNERERETFQLKNGDVLLTEASGSPQHVGRPVIWPEVEGLYCFQNTVIRFSPEGVTSEFAFHLFLAWQKLGVFQSLSGGVGINHLSAGKFSALAIPLPPITEQIELVNALAIAFESLASQENAVEHSLKQSTAQRQNILRAAFSGQLVPQDPSDEPASVLLERIRSERAAQASVPKVRKARAVKGVA